MLGGSKPPRALGRRVDPQQQDIDWIKVEAHSGIPANERCHSVVQRAIQNQQGATTYSCSYENWKGLLWPEPANVLDLGDGLFAAL